MDREYYWVPHLQCFVMSLGGNYDNWFIDTNKTIRIFEYSSVIKVNSNDWLKDQLGERE